jgi:hypothetical protein
MFRLARAVAIYGTLYTPDLLLCDSPATLPDGRCRFCSSLLTQLLGRHSHRFLFRIAGLRRQVRRAALLAGREEIS